MPVRTSVASALSDDMCYRREMRLSPTCVALSVVISLCCLPSCKDDEATTGTSPNTDAGTSSSGGPDGATPTDGGSSSGDGGPSGDCTGGDPATIDALAKILGGWRTSKTVQNTTESDPPDCDKTIGYFLGPEALLPADAAKYAQCAIAQGSVIPVKGGNYAAPVGTTCTELACSAIGMLMVSPKSAAVYALGPDGKTKGQAVFYFQPIPNASMSDADLFMSNTAQLANGSRLSRTVGAPGCQ
jgi:hypothetical protein